MPSWRPRRKPWAHPVFQPSLGWRQPGWPRPFGARHDDLFHGDRDVGSPGTGWAMRSPWVPTMIGNGSDRRAWGRILSRHGCRSCTQAFTRADRWG